MKLLRFLRSFAVSLPVFLVGALATYAQVRSASPPLDWPKDSAWFTQRPNPWMLLSALFSAVGAVSAILSFLAPKPHTAAGAAADRRHQNSSFAALDEREQERHGQTHRMLAGDITERAEAALEADAFDEAQKRRIVALARRIETALPEASAAQALLAAETAITLESSPFADVQKAGAEAIAGDLEGAADRLIAQATADKVQLAERYRQAARLYAPGAPSKAKAAYEEAVDLDPSDVWSWIELGRLRAIYDSLESARACFGAALQRVGDERDRKVLHDEFGDLLVTEGALGEARAEHEAGLAIAERLARREPGNSLWQRDLSISHNKLGDIEVAAGNLAAARNRFEASLAIREKLAAREASNSEWQRDLSISHNRLGEIEVAAGNLAAARNRFEASLAIREELAAREPGNSLWQRDLSISHNKIGEIEVAAGNLAAARNRFEASLAIAEQLAAREPGNSLWQRDLSISHDRLGEIEVTAGNLAAARNRFEASLAIAEQLAAREPGNSLWQRDLSISHNKIGEIEVAAGNLAAARNRFEASLAIAEQLAAREPGNSLWQRDLFISTFKLAELAEAEGESDGAATGFMAARTIIAALVTDHPDHPQFASDLEWIEGQIARLQG